MAEQIKIGADVSGVLSAIKKLRAEVDGLNKSLDGSEVNVRTDKAQRSLSTLAATADAARKALDAAGSAFGDSGGAQGRAIEELKDSLEEIEKLASEGIDLKLNTGQARTEIEKLRREMQRKSGGADAGSSDAALNAERRRALREEREERNRQRREAAAPKPSQDRPGAPSQQGSSQAPAGGNPARPGEPPKSYFKRFGEQLNNSGAHAGRMGRLGGVIGGVAGGMLAGGNGGGMMRSLGSGAGSLAGAGIGAMVGSIVPGAGTIVGALAGAALGGIGGAAGGKLDESIGEVIAEGLDLSNLQRAMGSTNTGFDELRDRLRYASAELQTTFGEMAKYGQSFAKHAGFRGGANELAEEVRHAVGFARGFGVDPQSGVQFSAAMRHTQASKSDQDSRKIGLSVAEAIGRGGLGPKADEVLSAIGNFANNSANKSLSAPDVASFASVLGAASATGIAGLAGNPGNAAAIIGQADAAMRQGGSYGMASSVMTDIALRRGGMAFGDVNLLKEQGLFGTEQGAFGADSAVQKSIRAKLNSGNISDSEKTQLKAELARLEGLAANGDGRTNADKVLEQLRDKAGNNPAAYRESMKNHFGLASSAQAEAFDTMIRTHGGTGALKKRLEAAGIDTSKVNPLSIGGMAEVFGADRSGLQRMGNELLKDGEFTSKHRDIASSLRSGLLGNDTEALRSALLQAKDKGAGNMTDVERANQASIDLKNEFLKYAQSMLPLVTSSKEALFALVSALAPGTDLAKQDKAERKAIEKAKNGDAADRKEQAKKMAEMVAQGANPINLDAAKLASEGAGDLSKTLNADAASYKKLSTYFNDYALGGLIKSRLVRSSERKQEEAARLKGLGYSTSNGGDIQVPPGATAGAAAPSSGAAPTAGAAAPSSGPPTAPKSKASDKQRDFVRTYGEAARKVGEQLGVDPAIILGQWGLETGWGKSIIPGTNNLGNIKDFSGGGVQATDSMNGSVDKYRAYGTVDDFADGFTSLIKKQKYRGAINAGKDSEKYFSSLKNGGYAEDQNYVKSGMSTTERVRGILAEEAAAKSVTGSEDLMCRIPAGGKDGPGATASSIPGGQPAVKVITEIRVLDKDGKERPDAKARTVSYESLPAGAH